MVTINQRIDEIIPPRPIISPIDSTDEKLNLFGKAPLHWTLTAVAEDDADARLEKYRNEFITDEFGQEIANIDYIPFYQLFVYKTDLDTDLVDEPFDSSSFLLKNEDSNDNDVNDWTEVNQGVDDNGRAYAVYRILASDILEDSRTAAEIADGQKDMFYQIPLIKIYEILRGPANVLQTDDQDNFIFHMRPQSIESGRYHFYLAGANLIDELGPVSVKQSIDIREDIDLNFAPKPNLLRPNSDDALTDNVKNRGQVPTYWKLSVGANDLPAGSRIVPPAGGTVDVSVLEDDFSLETSPAYVPTYQVYIYRDLGVNDPRVADGLNAGFIKQDDVNQNGISDWAEKSADRVDGVVGGRLYANYQLTIQDVDALVSLAIQSQLKDIESNAVSTDDVIEIESQTARLDADWIQTIGLDTFFRLQVDINGQPVKRDGKFVFEGDYQEVPVGTYSLFVFGINGMDLEGPLSDPKSVVIPEVISVPSTPGGLTLGSFTPNPDRNGILGVNWDLAGLSAPEKHRLDTYPLYEVIIAKTGDPLEETSRVNGDFGRDFVQSMGDFPLMVVDSESGDLRKVSQWPWVRDLRDLFFPLGHIPDGSTTFKNLSFEDDTTYFMRVRAYSHMGSVAKKGPWSNVQSVKVQLRDDVLIAPLVASTVAHAEAVVDLGEPADLLMNDPFGLLHDGTALGAYFIYYQIERDENGLTSAEIAKVNEAKTRAKFIEIWESEDGTTWESVRGDASKARNKFYLDTETSETRFELLGFPFWEFGRTPSTSVRFDDERFEVRIPEFGHSYYYAARLIESDYDESSPDRVNDSLPGEWSQIVRVNIDHNDFPDALLGPGQNGNRPQHTWRRRSPE